MPARVRRHSGRALTWFFDLDNTLHDATFASYLGINEGMTGYIVEHLGLTPAEAAALRQRYWRRYGATLLGLVRHHGVPAHHFLQHAHRLPGLEQRVYGHAHDLHALRRLARRPGRRCVLTNAPAAYTARVLGVLGIAGLFDAVFSIEDMRMFGQWRPKPDARMLQRMVVRMKARAADCVLVEDTLEHQKAARRIGMRTVWMQRWLLPAAAAGSRRPAGAAPGRERGAKTAPAPPTAAPAGTAAAPGGLTGPRPRPGAGRPLYVGRRIRRLGQLLRR